MDTSGDFYLHAALSQKAQIALHVARLKKGEKSSTKLTREELINFRNRIALKSIGVSDTPGTQIRYISHKYPPSVASFSALTKIFTQDLRLETNHRGHYMVLRTITPPTKAAGIVTVAEDENGECELVQFPVFDTDQAIIPNFLSESQVFIVKEPFYKSNTTGELETGTSVCVDHISDIIFLRPNDIRIPPKWQDQGHDLKTDKTAVNWKEEGNRLYGDGRLREAIECYTKGLETTIDGDDMDIMKILRLNRSQAFLKLSESTELHEEALNDVKYVLQSDPTNEKALFRGAQTLYQARRFEACKNFLFKLIRWYRELEGEVTGVKEELLKRANSELLKVFRRLQEEQTGKYDFQELRRLTSNAVHDNLKRPVRLDCADFVGPVSRQETTDSGWGLFTTRDVKFGELLLATKAFQLCHPRTHDTSITIDLVSGRIHKNNGRDRSVSEIVQKLYDNPSIAEEFLQLYGGSYGRQRVQERCVDGKPVIDTFLVHEIRLYNCFIHPLFSAATAQISVCEGRDTQEGVEASNGKIMVGKPSYINHACWGSVRRSAIGDMVMIRATREIKKGEQLALEYITLGEDVELRQRSLAFNWEFTCNCKLCKVESEEPLTVRNGRETLLNTILGFNLLLKNRRSLIVNLPKILKLVDSLEATYKNPPSKQPRHVLVTALEFLMKVYTRAQPEAKGWDEVIRIVKHILKALGYVIEESQVHQKVLIIVHGNFPNNLDLPEFLTICSTMYTLRGNHVMAKAWQRLAADFYEVTYGERVSFAERYGKEFAKVGYKLV